MGAVPHRPQERETPIDLRVAVRPGAGSEAFPERHLAWEHGERRVRRFGHGPPRRAHRPRRARVWTRRSPDGLLDAAPSFAARILLEAPVGRPPVAARIHGPPRRGGRRSARAPSSCAAPPVRGSRRSTAAAWRAGLGVLADESLLVSRDDADQLAASVRDLTLLPDAERAPRPRRCHGGRLHGRRGEAAGRPLPRLDARRRAVARRAATLLLGPRIARARSPRPARTRGVPDGVSRRGDPAGTTREATPTRSPRRGPDGRVVAPRRGRGSRRRRRLLSSLRRAPARLRDGLPSSRRPTSARPPAGRPRLRRAGAAVRRALRRVEERGGAAGGRAPPAPRHVPARAPRSSSSAAGRARTRSSSPRTAAGST